MQCCSELPSMQLMLTGPPQLLVIKRHHRELVIWRQHVQAVEQRRLGEADGVTRHAAAAVKHEHAAAREAHAVLRTCSKRTIMQQVRSMC